MRIIRLTDDDLKAAARSLSIEIAAFWAVDEVESNGDGFLKDGLCKILFERHWFWNLTDGKWSSNPDICNKSPGGYARGKDTEERGQREWLRFNCATSLNWSAAVQSTSWGRYQIMGFNYNLCGFQSLEAFHGAMIRDEKSQLDSFVRYLRSRRLNQVLRAKKWALFARMYNGPAYKRNAYHIKLAEAYERHRS